MKEEIKEILEDVKRHLDYVEATKQSSIRDNEMKAMYDYITNLQEENEELKTENEKLTQLWLNSQEKRRKAIEYIEKEKQLAMFADLRKEGTHQYTLECDADDLLNLLQGEDKE